MMRNLGAEFQSYLQRNQAQNETAQQTLTAAFKEPDVQEFMQAHLAELPTDFFDKSAAKVFEYVRQKRLLAAGKPTIAPGYVPELKLENGYVIVAYRPTEQAIKAEKIRRRQARIKAISMPKAVRNANFENVDVVADRGPIVIELLNWIDNFMDKPKTYHQGLYLYGTYGIGKTYLMGALANELADRGVEVTMVHFPTFTVEMRNSINDNAIDTMGQLQAIKTSTVLIIDDIGAESMSPWIRDDILGVILEYRMQNELATFFTSNFDMQQLQHQHLTETRQSIEPVKAERLMQRVRFLAREVLMGGENRRPGV